MEEKYQVLKAPVGNWMIAASSRILFLDIIYSNSKNAYLEYHKYLHMHFRFQKHYLLF